MITAKDMMNDAPDYCLLDDSVQSLTVRFAAEHCDGMLVVDEEKNLFGVITANDLIEPQRRLHIPTTLAIFDLVIPLGESRFEEEIATMQALTAKELMTAEVTTVQIDTPLDEISSMMAELRVHYLPVLQGDTVVGVITKHDVIRELAKHLKP
ncbi:MAG: CBS domain-containing protein [Zetaproteobacteria bacterium]|nr:CBS domain-containing protein [Zetaproteobacteria bacterium]